MPADAWDSRLVGTSRSIREIVGHLLEEDSEWLVLLGGKSLSLDASIESLRLSNEALIGLLQANWADRVDEAFAILTGDGKGMEQAVTYRQIEDYYHSGQIAWLRLSVEPEWEL
jgi:hypothetical protein